MLTLIDRISQKLPYISESRLQQIWDLIDSAEPSLIGDEKIDLNSLLKLSLQERDQIVTRQAQSIAHLFQPGSELLEWSDEYVEDDNWDDWHSPAANRSTDIAGDSKDSRLNFSASTSRLTWRTFISQAEVDLSTDVSGIIFPRSHVPHGTQS